MSKPYLYCLALPILLASVAFAQQNPTPALSAPPQPSSVAGEGAVKLDVVVTDKSGKPVSGLDLNDFTLLDNGQPGKILSFHAIGASAEEAQPPVEVILLIDAANSQFQGISDVCEQFRRFLSRNGGHLAQPVSIAVLTDGNLDLQPRPSLDGNALAADVNKIENRLRTVGPRAGNNGAVERFQFSVQMLKELAESEAKKPGRKLLVWAGHGWPVFDSSLPLVPSKTQLQTYFSMIVQLSTLLREARLSIDSVVPGSGLASNDYERFLSGVKAPENANTADLALKVLVLQSGGRILGPDNDMAGQIVTCIRDASAFYTLSFDPPRAEHANEYHDLQIQIGKPKLTARTNTGYYNRPETESGAAQAKPESSLNGNRPAGKPLTVRELEKLLKELHDKPDADAAQQLSGLALTERLSSPKLSALTAALPGGKAQQALVALADESAFRDPPTAEIPAMAAPDLATQRQIMAQAIDYLAKTLPKLPDFFATRVTAHYEESPPTFLKPATDAPGQPLHLVDTSSATVLYRNGHEMVDAETPKDKKSKGKKSNPQAQRVVLLGTFGPILSVVIENAANGHLSWSRWEQGANGPEAVFQFKVPKDKSQYVANSNGLPLNLQTYTLQEPTAYHGEIAVDPANGTILRLVMKADLDQKSPLLRADILVEYGPVEIGGRPYFCPVRSVSVSKGPFFQQLELGGNQTPGPEVTMLNDVVFGEYHLFRAETRLVTGNDAAPDAK
jgi:VWFA-related protein